MSVGFAFLQDAAWGCRADSGNFIRHQSKIDDEHDDCAESDEPARDLQIIVPGGIGFEFAFSDPFGVIFIDVFDFKIMRDVKLIQSDPDCKCNMASLSV